MVAPRGALSSKESMITLSSLMSATNSANSTKSAAPPAEATTAMVAPTTAPWLSTRLVSSSTTACSTPLMKSALVQASSRKLGFCGPPGRSGGEYACVVPAFTNRGACSSGSSPPGTIEPTRSARPAGMAGIGSCQRWVTPTRLRLKLPMLVRHKAIWRNLHRDVTGEENGKSASNGCAASV